MNKKAIAILGAIFLLIVATLVFLIYQRNSRDNKPADNVAVNNTPQIPDPSPANNTPSEQNPSDKPVDNGKANKLSDDGVISPQLHYDGNGISYFNVQGQLFTTDIQISGQSVFLSNRRELFIPQKSNIAKILWPKAGNDFIVEFQNGTRKSWSYYNSEKGAYLDLPAEIRSLDWLPSGQQIMFVWVDSNGNATLNIANPDTTGYKQLTDLYEPDNEISVSPDGNSVLFYRTQNNQAQNTLNFVSSDGKVFKTIVREGFNYGVKWSPDGRRFLFNRRDSGSQQAQLYIGDLSSGEVKNLGVSTIIDKAAWSSAGQSLFVAVPSKGNPEQSLTEDTILKLDLNGGNKEEFDTGGAVDARTLFLSRNDDKLFFKNMQDQALYYINVSK